jgi:hypothetical protein
LGELENGNAAWKASTKGTTTRIGLTDAEHTSSGNKQDSVAEIMNSAGQSIGISTRYQGASSAGQSAWFASSSGVTSKIGLAGTEFTSSTGYHYSSPEGLNVGGLVVGYTERYNGGTTLLGEATWASTQGGLTRRLGFNDALHTASNGTQFSAVTGLTDSGFIAGYSDRFSGSTALGITAWIYQPSLENPEALIFSTSLSGKAYTDIDLLLESGVAAGSFTLYDGETDLGRRAFAYLPGVGGFDLGTYIGGSQFSQLTQVLAANPDGFLTGLGTPLGTSGQAVFVAQAIPEPSALTLLAGAILLIVGSLTIRGRKFRRSALGLAFVAAAALFFSTPVQAGEPLSFSSWLDKCSGVCLRNGPGFSRLARVHRSPLGQLRRCQSCICLSAKLPKRRFRHNAGHGIDRSHELVACSW